MHNYGPVIWARRHTIVIIIHNYGPVIWAKMHSIVITDFNCGPINSGYSLNLFSQLFYSIKKLCNSALFRILKQQIIVYSKYVVTRFFKLNLYLKICSNYIFLSCTKVDQATLHMLNNSFIMTIFYTLPSRRDDINLIWNICANLNYKFLILSNITPKNY